MNEVVFIEGKIVDKYVDLAWDKTMMKFEFDLPDGSKYVTPKYLSSDAIIMSNTGSLYWGYSYEAWLEYDVTAKKIGEVYRNDEHVEYMKIKRQMNEIVQVKKERAKKVKKEYYPGTTVKFDSDAELDYIEEKYFSNNNDYTFW